MAAVDSRTVQGCRNLRFQSIDDVLNDLDKILAAHRAGTLKPLGNWTAGQNLAHVAAWAEYGYVGFPIPPAPWIVRSALKLMLKRYLTKGMPRGVKIPGVEAGTVGQEEMPVEQAVERVRTVFNRLKSGEKCTHDSPAFGALSHEQRILLNLRHAELHLSFLSLD